MRKNLFVSIFFLPLLGCSSGSASECAIEGVWFSASTSETMSFQGLQKSASIDPSPIQFNDNKTVTGGALDGVPMGGWVATNWECVDAERVVLSSPGQTPMGAAFVERFKIEGGNVIDFGPGMLGRNYLVRDQGNEQDTDSLFQEVISDN